MKTVLFALLFSSFILGTPQLAQAAEAGAKKDEKQPTADKKPPAPPAKAPDKKDDAWKMRDH